MNARPVHIKFVHIAGRLKRFGSGCGPVQPKTSWGSGVLKSSPAGIGQSYGGGSGGEAPESYENFAY